ncbi:hypothetical protein HHK36_025423 [Tetracentron sinense]|uniref:Uncharacterized protein n=1 Tax=Tetracentron sinense TaxID=13715 RepID=A0A835D311_TETSI|nr:hypothetical protein HHK36_025423 [Tetracentron sinense]
MASTKDQPTKKEVNKGAWAAEEDRKLAQVVEIHGPQKWKKEKQSRGSATQGPKPQKTSELLKDTEEVSEEPSSNGGMQSKEIFNVDEFFDWSSGGPLNLEWVSKFLEIDEVLCEFS